MHLRRTTWLTIALAAFLVALPAGRFGAAIDGGLLTAIGAIIALLAVPRRLRWPAVVAVGLLLGFVRGQFARSDYGAINARIGQQVAIAGTIADDPTQGDNSYYSFMLNSLKIDESHSRG